MNVIKTIAISLAAAAMLPAMAQEPANVQDVPKREHRAIWMTPFLNSNWPSGAVTESNAASMRSIVANRLAIFKKQNINVIYYHARSNCDATYRSSYEPWSSSVSGTRGKEPGMDVFGVLVEEAHKQGIEVYAWVNPYRYSNSTSTNPYGAGELNYENSHPEWLLRNANQTVLNPGIEAVKQRIVDVISEIVRNYDIDGVIFDDYFYGQGGTDMSADATQYNAYKSAGGTLTQADWRRANINEMVHRVSVAIKSIKPYCAFGISPAGVSSPTNVTTEYGLPSISGDWQYSTIYSDPLAWLKAGDIDFISPQIYWPNRFDELCQWWTNAAVKFNRHLYASIDLSDAATVKMPEFIREVEKTRELAPDGTAGIVYFQYADFVNYYERTFGTNKSFGDNMSIGAYPTKALTPIRHWNNKVSAAMTSNVRIEGTNLVWNAVKDARYTIYAYPKSETTPFGGGQEYLHGISYTNSYALPKDADSYNWYVAVYDRYGNEYSPLAVGATATTVAAPTLVYPANNGTAVDLFDFKWTNKAPGMSSVEVATDASFNNLVGTISTSAELASVTRLPLLESNKTYYWRVRFVPVNAPEVVSGTNSFKLSRIAVTGPSADATNVSLTPTVTWTKASDGADYTVAIARTATMATPDYTYTTNGNSVTVPAKTLVSGRPYYVQITAERNGRTAQSEIVKFNTANRTDYPAPTIVNPATDGATMYSNYGVTVAEWDGMQAVTINISSSNTFPTRSSYTATLSDFATVDKNLSDVKLSGSSLKTGTTYYVRARGTYYVDGAQKYTDYSPARTFVYNSEAGVNDITVDAAEGPVTYYNLQGIEIANPEPGQVVIRRSGNKATKQVIR